MAINERQLQILADTIRSVISYPLIIIVLFSHIEREGVFRGRQGMREAGGEGGRG